MPLSGRLGLANKLRPVFELNEGKSKYLVLARVVAKIGTFIDKNKQPKGLSLSKLLFNALIKHDYNALGALHHRSLFLGMMHFMDKYNHDEERLKRCDIHYLTPDLGLIPFCAFNVIPEWYRDATQQRYGIPIKEWERLNGQTLEQEFYRGELRKDKEHATGCGCPLGEPRQSEAELITTGEGLLRSGP